MATFTGLTSSDDWKKAMEVSQDKPVLVFKHSTTCPISARAYKEYNTFLETADDSIASYLVKVIEDRPVSNEIAESTGVKHESPQIFLIRNKEVVWNTSHDKITKASIQENLASVAQ